MVEKNRDLASFEADRLSLAALCCPRCDGLGFQREREVERREGRLASTAALHEKQHKARLQYLQTAEAHLVKLQSELQKERRVAHGDA